jgi:hypothetical protein
MALIAVAAAIYFTVEKVRDHKEKKHALKALETPQCGLPKPVSIIDNITAHHSMENLPPYHEEALPSYHKKSRSPYPMTDQHRMLKTNKQSAGSLTGGTFESI